ncbi:hypothetical protein J11TS1_35290 [Oceanobacillus sp. J11TS1]|nr:hypothetical protein J11TS1_35290 [Oceanobacillus sp. J11TS1]
MKAQSVKLVFSRHTKKEQTRLWSLPFRNAVYYGLYVGPACRMDSVTSVNFSKFVWNLAASFFASSS